jgi:UDP-N-acetylmuramate-alanine ligase
MKIIFPALLSGTISVIVSVSVTEYRFRRKNKQNWCSDVISLTSEIKTNIDKDKKEICEKSNNWEKECAELISNCPTSINESVIEDLNNISESCKDLSDMRIVPGGYNDKFNEKINKLEKTSESIENKIS